MRFSTTRFQRARWEVDARQRLIPFVAAFVLGWFGGGQAFYPLLRHVLFAGPFGPIKIAFLEAPPGSKACCEVRGSEFDPIAGWPLLAFDVLLLFCLVQELRRRSSAASLLRNRLYRVGLLAYTVSCFLASLSSEQSGATPANAALSVAAAAFLAAAWPRWNRARRLEAIALSALALSLAVLVRYYLDTLVLKG